MNKMPTKWNIEVNKTHWWFRARNLIIKTIINSIFKNKKNLKILDMGCGSGANLKMLSEYGNVFAMEPSEEFIEYASKENPDCKILQGAMPDNNPYKNEKFDLIVSLDVIEHIENDLKTLIELKNMLNDNGKIIITVPAFQFLFSQDDIVACHYRRYSKKTLKQLIKEAGFKKFSIYYFNTILFLPIAIVRMLLKITGKTSESQDKVATNYFNNLFYHLLSFERHTLKINPFGISLCAILEKNTNE